MRGNGEYASSHALKEYSGHLIDLCEDILALWVYDELTKSQVVRCRKTRFGGVHVLLRYMFIKQRQYGSTADPDAEIKADAEIEMQRSVDLQ